MSESCIARILLTHGDFRLWFKFGFISVSFELVQGSRERTWQRGFRPLGGCWLFGCWVLKTIIIYTMRVCVCVVRIHGRAKAKKKSIVMNSTNDDDDDDDNNNNNNNNNNKREREREREQNQKKKNQTQKVRSLGPQGIEPWSRGLESLMLPLHHSPTNSRTGWIGDKYIYTYYSHSANMPPSLLFLRPACHAHASVHPA